MNSWIEYITQYKKLILIICIIISVVLGFGIQKLTLDADTKSLLGDTQGQLEQKLPAIGADTRVATVVVHDPNLFSQNKLDKLQLFQNEIEKLSFVKRVSSLFNTPDIAQYFIDNSWHPILNTIQNNQFNLVQAKKNALANKTLIHHLISPDANSMALIIQIKNTLPDHELISAREKIEKIIKQYSANFEELFQVGELEVKYFNYTDSMHDISITGSLALLVLIIVFGVLFKSPYLGLIPFLTFGLAMLWTLGIMGFFHIPLNVLASVAAIMTYTVGSMENAHFINAFQKSQREQSNAKLNQHLVFTYRSVFIPIIFATITTIFGFLFNLFSSLKLLENFAITICLSITLNTLIICVLTPILLCFTKTHDKTTIQFSAIKKLALYTHTKLLRHPIITTTAMLFILGFSVWIIPKLSLEVMQSSYYFKDSELLQKITKTDRYISGTERLAINISTENPKGFMNKANLDKLFNAELSIQQLPETSSTTSIASIIASTFRIFLDEDQFYKIPEKQSYINEFYRNLEDSNSIDYLQSSDRQIVRLLISFHAYTTTDMITYINKIKSILNTATKSSDLRYEISSHGLDFLNTLLYVLKIQLIAMSLIYISIFIVMFMMFRSFKAGIIAMIPNIFPLAAIIILLYLASIPLNVVTVIVLAAILGLAVDDTIHIMCSFKKHYLISRDVNTAIQESIHTQFRPVTITTITLVAGMCMLVFSVIKGSVQYGLLMAVGAIAAWFSDLIVTPFLLKKINITKKL